MQQAKHAALRFHWVMIPLLLFILGQVYSFGLLAHEKSRQEAIPANDESQYFVKHHKADPAWETYVAGWNGQAYREIATNGYPVIPPKSPDGSTLPNPWSFYPLYPLVVKAVMALTGLDFGYAALGVSLFFGLGAVILLYRLVDDFSKNKWVAGTSVAALLAYPAAPLFQLAYNESLALFLLIAAMSLVHKQRYAWAMVPLILLGLTRAIGPPDFALLLLHGAYLSRAYLWPLSRVASGLRTLTKSTKALTYVALIAISGLAAGLWPLLAWLATGENAFINSREGYARGQELRLFPWFTDGLTTSDAYPLAPLAVLALYLGLAVLQLSNKRLPHIMRLWPLVLCFYIFAVSGPAGNEQRYLMLGLFTVPLLPWPQHRIPRMAYVAGVVLIFALLLYLQHSWVHYHWVSETGVLRKNV